MEESLTTLGWILAKSILNERGERGSGCRPGPDLLTLKEMLLGPFFWPLNIEKP